MTQQIRCSSCGGAHSVDEAFARIFACCYCGLVSRIDGGSLTVVGRSTQIAVNQGLFSIGMRGTYRDESFTVVGRIRYHHEAGVWDEWQLICGGRPMWVQQDEGRLTVFHREEVITDAPPFYSLEAGRNVSLGGSSFFVSEIGEGVIAALSGQIPRDVAVGQGFFFVEGIGAKISISVEYYFTEVVLYEGIKALPEQFKSEPI